MGLPFPLLLALDRTAMHRLPVVGLLAQVYPGALRLGMGESRRGHAGTIRKSKGTVQIEAEIPEPNSKTKTPR